MMILKTDDILSSFELRDVERRKYNAVKNKFDNHFMPQRNIIYECSKFNQQQQQEEKTTDDIYHRPVTLGKPVRLWWTIHVTI